MRIPAYAQFVAWVFGGLIVCAAYIIGADIGCPIDERKPLRTDDLHVYQWSQQEKQTQNQGNNHGAGQKFGTIISSFAFLQAKAEQPPTANQPDNKDHKTRKWVHIVCEVKLADIAIAFFTYCLVLVTGYLVSATVGLQKATVGLYRAGERQIRVAKEAADAAKLNAQSVIESERARLYVFIEHETISHEFTRIIDHLKVNPPEVVRNPPVTPPRPPKLRIEYRFKNYGKTPAYIMEIGHGTDITEDEPKGRHYTVQIPLPVEAVLAAGETTRTISDIAMPRASIETAKDIRDLKATLWFHGYVEYDDTFGWRRKLHFVWHYSAISNGFSLYSYQETVEKRENAGLSGPT